MPRRVETRFEMLADQPEWMRPRGPAPLPALYHGSVAKLNPGDIVVSSQTTNPLQSEINKLPTFPEFEKSHPAHSTQFAWASPDINTARQYAVPYAYHNPSDEEQEEGYVYEVAPVDPNFVYGEKGMGSVYGSKKGWKVIQLIEVMRKDNGFYTGFPA